MDLETALRAKGCRVTRPRQVVWDVLTESGEHLSAPVITERVHAVDPSINSSSVYRALTVFAEIGLVRESRLDESATWEPFHDDSVIHLRCTSCGTVSHHHTDLVRRLRRDVQTDAAFGPDEIDVRVEGTCSACHGRSSPTR